jgi:hypothetical protein
MSGAVFNFYTGSSGAPGASGFPASTPGGRQTSRPPKKKPEDSKCKFFENCRFAGCKRRHSALRDAVLKKVDGNCRFWPECKKGSECPFPHPDNNGHIHDKLNTVDHPEHTEPDPEETFSEKIVSAISQASNPLGSSVDELTTVFRIFTAQVLSSNYQIVASNKFFSLR